MDFEYLLYNCLVVAIVGSEGNHAYIDVFRLSNEIFLDKLRSVLTNKR